MTTTQKIIALLGVITLWLTFQSFDEFETEEIVMSSEVSRIHSNKMKPHTEPVLLKLIERQRTAMRSNLFDVQVKAKSVLAPPILSSTDEENLDLPLPFRYIGLWKTADQLTVMLEHQDQTLVLKAGDFIDNNYQVLAIEQTGELIDITILSVAENKEKHMTVLVN